MKTTHRVTASISKKEHKELFSLAKQHRVSVAWIVRTAIIRFLDQTREDPESFYLFSTEQLPGSAK